MHFNVAFIPAILLTGMIYLLFAAGLWKNEIKKVYSRRTKREKILTVCVLAASVLLMLLVAARCGDELQATGKLSLHIQDMLLWLFNGNVQLLCMAEFIVCSVPVMVVSAALLDEIGQKKVVMALPFYEYLLLFMVNLLFYKPLTISIISWFALLLFAGLLYGCVKMYYEGTNKKKAVLYLIMMVMILAIIVIEKAVPVAALLKYLVLLIINGLVTLCVNRASVLKKRFWYAVTLVCYLILFFVGRLF